MNENLIPGPYQDELFNIRHRRTRDSWRIGDICRELLDDPERETVGMKDDIFRGVASIAGLETRTVREFYYLAGFFDPVIRLMFDVLAYDHFRHAATLGEERATEALQWAVDQGDKMGRPATVNAMMARFAPPEPGAPDGAGWQEEPTRIVYQGLTNQLQAVERFMDLDLPPQLRDELGRYYDAGRVLVEHIDQLEKIAA